MRGDKRRYEKIISSDEVTLEARWGAPKYKFPKH